MHLRRAAVIVVVWFGFMGSVQVYSQFYNGLQMQFGKNRIQYGQADIIESDFYYSYYRFDQFDVYFNPDGQELAKYVGKKVFQELALLENYFEHTLNKRIIFLSYNKLTDFRQSNIGLITGQENTNIGGATRILDNKVFLYFDGNHAHLDEQIRAAIAGVLLEEMIYGGNVRERVTTSTLMNLPEWFYDGLIAYVSKDWDVDIENRIRDGILSGRFEKFNQLMGEEAIDAGHSLWHFIAETFGESVIPNIIYFSKINRSGSAGFLNVLGVSLSALTYEWLYYYKSRFEKESAIAADPIPREIALKARKHMDYVRTRMSPDGRYIAYSTLQKGQAKVFLYDAQTGKSQGVYKQGAKLQQIEDETIPVFDWHPSGEILGLISEYKGYIRFGRFQLSTQEWEYSELKNFQKVLDFDYANDGLSIVLSGVRNGQSDIFVHNLVAHTNEQITRDLADDLSPRFGHGDREIIFSSNRVTTDLTQAADTTEFNPSFDLYVYDYQNNDKELTRMAGDRYLNRIQPLPVGEEEYVFLGDDNGILNRYLARYDSTIAFIDTITHYRYFTETQPLTNYSRNILDHSSGDQAGAFSDLFLADNQYFLSRHSMDRWSDKQLTKTTFREKLTRKLSREDSLARARKDYFTALAKESSKVSRLGQGDSLPKGRQFVNINQYKFNEEQVGAPQSVSRGYGRSDGQRDPVTGRKYELPSLRIYQPSFYINYLASQVDFSFLNASYQPFTGGNGYSNPYLSFFNLIGAKDLFEDYKITGGFRLVQNQVYNPYEGYYRNIPTAEYMLSASNLKKRLDYEFVFHRQSAYQQLGVYPVQTLTHTLFSILRYPLSQVASFRGTFTTRKDNTILPSVDQLLVNQPDISKYWLGAKGEFVYDNTYILGLNLLEGTRLKLFFEYYQQVNLPLDHVFITGTDIRHYQPLSRTLIWANRIAGSTSFGSGRLNYYMGAVDNWINLSSTVPTFNTDQAVDPEQNFVFQALATNMRGFSQNIRNGNSFFVFNSEIRWPVIKYFVQRPLNSDFLNNFQVVGFFDLGSAWSGPHPWHIRNHQNNIVIDRKPIIVTIYKGDEPLVAGFGFGLRSRLMGYFVRADWAWGIENYTLLPRLFHLSLSLDF